MEGRLQIFSGNANQPLAQETEGQPTVNLGRSTLSEFQNA